MCSVYDDGGEQYSNFRDTETLRIKNHGLILTFSLGFQTFGNLMYKFWESQVPYRECLKSCLKVLLFLIVREYKKSAVVFSELSNFKCPFIQCFYDQLLDNIQIWLLHVKVPVPLLSACVSGHRLIHRSSQTTEFKLALLFCIFTNFRDFCN